MLFSPLFLLKQQRLYNINALLKQQSSIYRQEITILAENLELKARTIAQRYFTNEDIAAVAARSGRVVVTLQKEAADQAKIQALEQELAALDGVKKVNIITCSQREEPVLNPQDAKWQIAGVRRIIAVASGKGGVGKSTTAVNLALALSKRGKRVAVFDADIYGPSIPVMLGYEGEPTVSPNGVHIAAFEAFGLKSISIGSLIDRDTPIIWRGAKAGGALEQLMIQTAWGDIDIMLLDMPPGTGDIQITWAQKLKIDGAVIVSTPQDIALIDAVKGVNMFQKIGIPILGIVENMSYYICPKCSHKEEIFGHAGAAEAAEKMGLKFLGEVPLHIDIRTAADGGRPIVEDKPESPQAEAYGQIADKILAQL